MYFWQVFSGWRTSKSLNGAVRRRASMTSIAVKYACGFQTKAPLIFGVSVMLVFLHWPGAIIFGKDEVFPHSWFSHLWWWVLFGSDDTPTLPQLEIIGDNLFSLHMKKERLNDFSDKIYDSTFWFWPVRNVPFWLGFSACNSGSFASQYLCWSLMKVQKECGYHHVYSEQTYFTEIPSVTTFLTLCSALCSTQGIKLCPNHKLGITF